MHDKSLFEVLQQNVIKYETKIEKYGLQQTKCKPSNNDLEPKSRTGSRASGEVFRKSVPEIIPTLSNEIPKITCVTEKYAAFEEFPYTEAPKICTWVFMNQREINNLFKDAHKKGKTRIMIGNTID